MVFDGNRLAHHRLLVEDSVAALGDSEMRKVQCCGAVSCHVSSSAGPKGSGGMMDTERSGKLRITLDVVGPLRPGGAALAITIACFENQYVLADPGVYKHRAGKHRAAVPTAAAIAIKFEVAFLQAKRA